MLNHATYERHVTPWLFPALVSGRPGCGLRRILVSKGVVTDIAYSGPLYLTCGWARYNESFICPVERSRVFLQHPDQAGWGFLSLILL